MTDTDIGQIQQLTINEINQRAKDDIEFQEYLRKDKRRTEIKETLQRFYGTDNMALIRLRQEEDKTKRQRTQNLMKLVRWVLRWVLLLSGVATFLSAMPFAQGRHAADLYWFFGLGLYSFIAVASWMCLGFYGQHTIR